VTRTVQPAATADETRTTTAIRRTDAMETFIA
jgi:hypothetical protein